MWLIVVCGSLRVVFVCWLLCVVCWCLAGDRCVLFVGCGLLFVVCCLLSAVSSCVSFTIRSLPFVVCRVLFGVYPLVFVAWCLSRGVCCVVCCVVCWCLSVVCCLFVA